MFSLNTRLTLALYLLCVFVMLYSKPDFIFDEQGNLKKFGVSSKEESTVFPLWLIFTLFAIISYFVISYFNL